MGTVMVDEGYLTHMQDIPVHGLTFGDTEDYNKDFHYTTGPLICYQGMENITNSLKKYLYFDNILKTVRMLKFIFMLHIKIICSIQPDISNISV